MLASFTCPSCWRQVRPGAVCFIAEHGALVGDPMLGPEEALRFHPSRLDEKGHALDPEGRTCRRLACPHCHIELPRACLELPAHFVSAIGAPASGKSHLLTAMAWRLRQVGGRAGFSFADAEPALNATLHEWEALLFLPTGGGAPGPAGQATAGPRVAALPKTETGASRLSRDVVIGRQVERLPLPFLFTVRPVGGDPRLLVLYDNAGEHFLPGGDRMGGGEAATGHLERSDALLVVLDPLQDHRFRAAAETAAGAEGLPIEEGAVRVAERQELVIAEAAARIRRLRGLPAAAPIALPVAVALTKADLWAALVPEIDLAREPLDDGRLDTEAVRGASARCRALLERLCPELAAAAEEAFAEPIFLPVSAFGRRPALMSDRGRMVVGVPAGDVRPRWAEAPLLTLLGTLADSDPKAPPAPNHA